RSLDLLIINGGGQLTEWGGPWEFPYTIFKWIWLARLAKVRRVFLNVGAGPLTTPLSKFFVRHALQLADYASFRDEESRTLACHIGFTGRSRVFPDSVYSLTRPQPRWPRPYCGQGKASVGLAPMPYCDPRAFPEKNQAVYDALVEKLGRFGSWLLGEGYSLVLFGSDIGVDPLAIADVRAVIAADQSGVTDSPPIITERVGSTEELLGAMSAMDYIVTCRF